MHKHMMVHAMFVVVCVEQHVCLQCCLASLMVSHRMSVQLCHVLHTA